MYATKRRLTRDVKRQDRKEKKERKDTEKSKEILPREKMFRNHGLYELPSCCKQPRRYITTKSTLALICSRSCILLRLMRS